MAHIIAKTQSSTVFITLAWCSGSTRLVKSGGRSGLLGIIVWTDGWREGLILDIGWAANGYGWASGTGLIKVI